MSEIRTRVLIIGGGLVGQSLGLALARAGIANVIIDRESPETQTAPPFDGRASGTVRRVWDARDDSGAALPSGVYFLRLTTGDGMDAVRKAAVVR